MKCLISRSVDGETSALEDVVLLCKHSTMSIRHGLFVTTWAEMALKMLEQTFEHKDGALSHSPVSPCLLSRSAAEDSWRLWEAVESHESSNRCKVSLLKACRGVVSNQLPTAQLLRTAFGKSAFKVRCKPPYRVFWECLICLGAGWPISHLHKKIACLYEEIVATDFYTIFRQTWPQRYSPIVNFLLCLPIFVKHKLTFLLT